MPGTLIKFSFAILQSCQQRIVLDMYNTKISSHKIEIASHSFFKECELIFFHTEFCAWIHAWYFVSLLHRVYNYSLLTALQNCKCEFNQGSRHSSIFEFEFVWQKFPHHALTFFFVFDSIDKYRIDSDRIIFKILKKKNLLFWIFPLWISSFTRKKTKENLFDFFLPFLFLYIPCLRKHSPIIQICNYLLIVIFCWRVWSKIFISNYFH